MTTKKKTFTSLCLAVCVLAGLLCADSAFATVLNVKQHYQEENQWCWAATSQAILEFYGIIQTQTAIAKYGTDSENIWNYIYGSGTDPVRNGVDLILKNFGGPATTRYARYLSETEVENQIDSLRPIAIRWAWDSGGGHILAIKGMAGSTLYLMDPWNGNAQISTYLWVVRGDSTHTWTHSLTMNDAPSETIAVIVNPFSSSITSNEAKAGATMQSPGAALPTATGVAYGLVINPTITGLRAATTPASTGGVFSVTLTRLAANTTYHYRAYATSVAGTAYSQDSTFTTLADEPKATAATAITASGFTASWRPPSGDAPINYYNLYVATDIGFTDVIQNVSVSGTSHQVTVPDAGTYYYRVNAVNAGGTSANSKTATVNVR
jgi:hypothetical protein